MPDQLYKDKENICKESLCKNCGVCESRLTGPFLLVRLRIRIQIDRIRPYTKKSRILKKNSIKIRPFRINRIRNEHGYGSDLKNLFWIHLSLFLLIKIFFLMEKKNTISDFRGDSHSTHRKIRSRFELTKNRSRTRPKYPDPQPCLRVRCIGKP